MSAFYPHRYTITSLVGVVYRTPLSVIATDGGILDVPSCGLDVDELSALSQYLQSRLAEFGGYCNYVRLSNDSAVLIIKDGFDAVSRCNSNSLSDKTVGDMNSFFSIVAGKKSKAGAESVSFVIDDHTPMDRLTSTVRSFDAALKCLVQNKATIHGHIGASVVMTVPPLSIMSRQFGIDNGDLYLVCGPINPLIGNTSDFYIQ